MIPPLSPTTASAFETWITGQDNLVDWETITPTEQMRMAWNAAVKASAKQCKEYEHSGESVCWRQATRACRLRIETLIEISNGLASS